MTIARIAEVHRVTKETNVFVKINIDGNGSFNINTGIGFLDHMLEQLSKHSLIDLEVKVEGDLHIDGHHTTEDCGIAVGEAIKKAVGDKKGIHRYAHSYLPMDETLSRVALDFSGRPYLIWNVDFTRDKIGEMDSELFREWFNAFAMSSNITLHVDNIRGINNHHIIESCFKSLAVSLKKALAIDPRNKNAIPSTKGAL